MRFHRRLAVAARHSRDGLKANASASNLRRPRGEHAPATPTSAGVNRCVGFDEGTW